MVTGMPLEPTHVDLVTVRERSGPASRHPHSTVPAWYGVSGTTGSPISIESSRM